MLILRYNVITTVCVDVISRLVSVKAVQQLLQHIVIKAAVCVGVKKPRMGGIVNLVVLRVSAHTDVLPITNREECANHDHVIVLADAHQGEIVRCVIHRMLCSLTAVRLVSMDVLRCQSAGERVTATVRDRANMDAR